MDGEVVSFTSHGAMVDVSLPGGGVLHCYIPLTAMGTPPPTKARQVLKKGEVRPFVLAGLDPPRRVAELALPPAGAGEEVDRQEGGRPEEVRFGDQDGAGEEGGSRPTKKTAAKKAARRPRRWRPRRPARPPRRRRPRRRAKAKKAPAKKAAKKAPAKKATKAPAKKAAKASPR